MKMNKGALIMALLMAAHVCNAAVLPSGSRFDPRNQIVSYNPNNTTIINSAVGYTTTLVFDEDETVISARTGFPQGWAEMPVLVHGKVCVVRKAGLVSLRE